MGSRCKHDSGALEGPKPHYQLYGNSRPPKIETVEDADPSHPPHSEVDVEWRKVAETLGWEAAQVDCAIENITFISVAELRQYIPTAEMHGKIMNIMYITSMGVGSTDAGNDCNFRSKLPVTYLMIGSSCMRRR